MGLEKKYTGRTMVIGDIHGQYEMMMEVFGRSRFDYANDFLIIIGDVVDGGLRTFDVVEELLNIKNKVLVLGNHDKWFINYIERGDMPNIWRSQGGDETLESYNFGGREGWDIRVPDEHKRFFFTGRYYYVLRNMVFVHGGFDPNESIMQQFADTLMWDRTIIEMFYDGRKNCADGFDKIFVGHTTTQRYKSLLPLKFGNLWMLDTGGGFDGKLTIMDVDTEQYWQSCFYDRGWLSEKWNRGR